MAYELYWILQCFKLNRCSDCSMGHFEMKDHSCGFLVGNYLLYGHQYLLLSINLAVPLISERTLW